ncbi:hypothetical protein B0H11DRAFT_1940828 [Mycena galericulata]|nr:hypothetical protein B0H11DRAFT_1940828 [Mycena galericulata]
MYKVVGKMRGMYEARTHNAADRSWTLSMPGDGACKAHAVVDIVDGVVEVVDDARRASLMASRSPMIAPDETDKAHAARRRSYTAVGGAEASKKCGVRVHISVMRDVPMPVDCAPTVRWEGRPGSGGQEREREREQLEGRPGSGSGAGSRKQERPREKPVEPGTDENAENTGVLSSIFFVPPKWPGNGYPGQPETGKSPT